MMKQSLIAIDRIKQLAKENKDVNVELELRGKEDNCQTGVIIFVGDDYVEIKNSTQTDIEKMDEEKKKYIEITYYDVITIILLKDIRAFSTITEKGSVCQTN